MSEYNPRAVIGSNSRPEGLEREQELEKIIRTAKAEYNLAAEIKRDATGIMRDEKRAFQQENAIVYEELQAIMESTRERLKLKFRARPAYMQAEENKRDASVKMKEAVKKLKAAGCDVQAFKQVLKMAEMDPIERQEHFDAIDIYCKVLHLW